MLNYFNMLGFWDFPPSVLQNFSILFYFEYFMVGLFVLMYVLTGFSQNAALELVSSGSQPLS